MINSNAAFKSEIPYNGPFELKRHWTNVMVTLKCGAIKIRYNIRHIQTFTSDANVEDIRCWEIMIDDVAFGKYHLYTFVLN